MPSSIGDPAMTQPLVIVGAGEFAQIAAEYFSVDAAREVAAFVVHSEYRKQESVNGIPVFTIEEMVERFPPAEFELFVAIPATGLNRLRTKLYLEAKASGYRFATYVSSRAFVWRNATVGENCFIFEHNTIQPFVTIGDNSILWSGNHVGHRSVIGKNCFISSHVVISGYCTIGDSTFLGVNATLNDKVSIAEDCVLASGSLVNKSLKVPGRIYYGSPAKELPKRSAFDVKF